MWLECEYCATRWLCGESCMLNSLTESRTFEVSNEIGMDMIATIKQNRYEDS